MLDHCTSRPPAASALVHRTAELLAGLRHVAGGGSSNRVADVFCPRETYGSGMDFAPVRRHVPERARGLRGAVPCTRSGLVNERGTE